MVLRRAGRYSHCTRVVQQHYSTIRPPLDSGRKRRSTHCTSIHDGSSAQECGVVAFTTLGHNNKQQHRFSSSTLWRTASGRHTRNADVVGPSLCHCVSQTVPKHATDQLSPTCISLASMFRPRYGMWHFCFSFGVHFECARELSCPLQPRSTNQLLRTRQSTWNCQGQE